MSETNGDAPEKVVREHRSPHYVSLKKLEQTLMRCNGFIAQTAKQLGISQQAVRHRIKKHKRLQDTLAAIDDIVADYATYHIHSGVVRGDRYALDVWLRTKGHRYGFIERKQLDVNETCNVNFVLKPFDVVTVEEISRIRNAANESLRDVEELPAPIDYEIEEGDNGNGNGRDDTAHRH